MNYSKDAKVQKFILDLSLIDSDAYEIIIEIRELIFSSYDIVDEKMMYGGIVFFYKSELFSGLFVRKHHVSLEFSNGHLMKDPWKKLEGKGKYRRHLKIKHRDDVKSKDVAFFVKQAIL